MFVNWQNLFLAAATFASGVSALAGIPVVTKVTVPKLARTPLESKLVCLKGEIALALLTKVNYQTAAYSFCSSFISIPAATASVTVTETSFTPTTTTVPVTETETVTLPDATITTTVTAGAVAKRGYPYATPAVPFKSAIAAIKSDLISAGCSCIRTKIPLATSTSTLTATITQASPTIDAFSTITETTTTQTTTTVTVTLPGAPDASCNGAGICLNLQCDSPASKLMKYRRQADGQRTSRNDGSNTIGGAAT
ncbi:hypothetical protein N0V87_005915 [Didymella glomerata]|uniref:Uncharacterized protein n=1 Tax=Didymella glomerata TaxID=749621 RepID=A0A9W8WXQ2_9PLEO|nr:hypothetical protein N0V87_005915 [Didymella glomerata]